MKVFKKIGVSMLITSLLVVNSSSLILAKSIDEKYVAENTLTIKDSIKRSELNKNMKAAGSSLERKYNTLDKHNIVRKDRRDLINGWAFGFTNALEAIMSVKYNKPNQNYSPMHIDYRTTQTYDRIAGACGQPRVALNYSISGDGPINESDLPFESVYEEGGHHCKPIDSVDLNKPVQVRVNGTTEFPEIHKTFQNGKVKYLDSYTKGKTTTGDIWFPGKEVSPEVVNAARVYIKNYIKENGAIIAEYPGYSLNAEKYPYKSADKSYCFTNYEEGYQQDTTITVVGWDDDYAVSNFTTGGKPINPGAYICLTSRGSGYGDNGIIYVSYDDVYIETKMKGIYSVEQNKDFDKKYEYDKLGNSHIGYFLNDNAAGYPTELFLANVFARDKSKTETLTKVGVALGNTCGLEVYVNAKDDNINNATKVATYVDSNALSGGYHEIKLAEPVTLTGDKFAISIKLTNKERIALPLEDNSIDHWSKVTANKGESFISRDGKKWEDVNGFIMNHTENNQKAFENSNCCIKGFTTFDGGNIPEPEPEVTEKKVTGVILNKNTLDLKIGDTFKLVETIAPVDATNKNVTWSSDNSNVASVNGGLVTANGKGNAKITVKTEDGNYTAICNVVVTEKINPKPDPEPEPEVTEKKVTGVTLNKNTLDLKVGDTFKLVETIAPVDATNKNVTWSSDNSNVVSVNGGLVTANGKGNAKITVKTEDGNYTAICNVVVTEKINPKPDPEPEPEVTEKKVTGVSLSVNSLELTVGGAFEIIATITPSDATNKNLIWKSDNPDIATVTNGLIKGVKEGTATVTVTTEDGGYEAFCTVRIVAEDSNPDTKPDTKPDYVEVKEIKLNKKEVTLEVGVQSSEVIATVLPENATDKDLIWTSSNKNVVEVSDTGVMNPISKGSAVITVSTKDEKVTNSFKVTVIEKKNDGDDIYNPEPDEEKENNNDSNKPNSDGSATDGKLPFAGLNAALLISISLVMISFVLFRYKYNKYKDIK